MRLLIVAISMFAFNTFASVVLTGKPVKVLENPIILEKVSDTPFNNIIELPVVSNFKECLDYTELLVTEQNGDICGYESEPITVCRGVSDCVIFYEQVERSCSYFKKTCNRFEVVYKEESRTFNLQFSSFSKEVKVRLSIDKNEKLSLDVLDLDSNCVKKVFYKKNNKFTGAKLKLRRRCR